MTKGLVWFRNDLRIMDNEALYRAARQNDKIYAVYIFDPRQFGMTEPGFPRAGGLRVKFLIESVSDLRANLRRLGGDLIIRIGMPELILPGLMDETGSRALYCSKECTTEELAVQEAVEERLHDMGIRMDTFWQHTLYHEEDVPWPIRQVPEVFTTFRKEAESSARVRDAFPAPEKLNNIGSIPAGDVPQCNDLGVKEEEADERSVIMFRGGETAAWERLNYYFWEEDLLQHYKFTRNGLLGGDYSSKLSPWLASGCISPRSVYFEINKYEKERKKNISTYWLFFELLWRDFFRFMAKKHGSRIFLTEGFSGEVPAFSDDLGKFEKWKNGETGIPFIDANMMELNLTGYMSNRGRQNTASYLIHDLGVRWTWGARWFENRLIDYDPSSNWLNWAYIAGVGNDPRQGRQFNIENQASRYDPQGKHAAFWLKEQTMEISRPG